jgi:hypothetical protein
MRSMHLLVVAVVAFTVNLVLDLAFGAPLWLRWTVAVGVAAVAGWALMELTRRSSSAEPRA